MRILYFQSWCKIHKRTIESDCALENSSIPFITFPSRYSNWVCRDRSGRIAFGETFDQRTAGDAMMILKCMYTRVFIYVCMYLHTVKQLLIWSCKCILYLMQFSVTLSDKKNDYRTAAVSNFPCWRSTAVCVTSGNYILFYGLFDVWKYV